MHRLPRLRVPAMPHVRAAEADGRGHCRPVRHPAGGASYGRGPAGFREADLDRQAVGETALTELTPGERLDRLERLVLALATLIDGMIGVSNNHGAIAAAAGIELGELGRRVQADQEQLIAERFADGVRLK